jgi:hypothetical protein
MNQHTSTKIRTENRNQVFLVNYTEYAYRKIMKTHVYSMGEINEIVTGFEDPKEINKFFDKFTIAFGNWLLHRTPRTLEHSMEELVAEFRDQLSVAPDNEQIDN